MNYKNYTWLSVICLSLALAGCSSESGQEEQAGPAAPTPVEAPGQAGGQLRSRELDLSAVMRNAHFAFRAGDQGFRGGHSTYEANVDSRRIRLLPVAGRSAEPPSALELSTVSVAGQASPVAEPTPRGGALTVDRGVAREVLENTEDGLEQSWEFDTQPALSGEDLTVRVRVSGQEFKGETSTGLHFADAQTGLGFRYGLATWIDASGKRTTLVPKYSRGEISIEVPKSVVEASQFPAVLDPVVGPELAVDSPIPQASPNVEAEVSLSCATSGCLAVWVNKQSQIYQVVGARLDAAGTPLDPLGFTLAEWHFEPSPQVASDGTDYLVVWFASGVTAARVSATSGLLDAVPISLSNSYGRPAVAFGTDSYLVTWAQSVMGNEDDIHGKRVNTMGTVLDATPIVISNAANSQVDPVVGFNGTSFLVAWKDSRNSASTYDTRELWGARVTTSGTVLDTTGNLISLDRQYKSLDVASDGSGYLLSWERDCASCDVSIRGNSVEAVRVASNGRPLDATPITLAADTASTHDYARPRVAFGGGNYVVTWGYHAADWLLRAARVAPAGNVLDAAPGKTISSLSGVNQTRPDVAWTGSGFRVAWDDDRAGATDTDIYNFQLDASLVGGGPGTLVSKAANRQDQPTVAFNGSHYLVVWRDNRAIAQTDLYAVRVSASGAVLDSHGIFLGGTTASETTPKVASNGDNFLVVWGTEENAPGTIRAARVSSAGGLLGTFMIRASSGYQPAVTANGNDYYVAWLDTESWGLTLPYLYGARVSGAGVVLDATPHKLTYAGDSLGKSSLAVAASSNKLLAVYQYLQSPVAFKGRYIDAATGAGDGNLVDLGSGASAGGIDVAANGTSFQVVWSDGKDLWTRNARPDYLGGTSRFAGSIDTQQRPAITWDGLHFLATWQSQSQNYWNRWDIGFRRFGGSVITTFPVADKWMKESSPAIAAGAPNQALVVYELFDGATGSWANRVVARLVDDRLGEGVSCTDSGECSSGFCVDGVCCDSACDGVCEACTATLKGKGMNGGCDTIVANKDPQNECADQSPSSCGQDGMCDGVGACRLYSAGIVCGVATTCSSNRPVARECDGAGSCVDSPGANCAPYACAAGACSSPCAGDGDCAAGYNCENNACVSDNPSGGVGGTGGASAGGAGGAGTGGVGAGGSGGMSTGGASIGGAGGTSGAATGGAGGAVANGGSAGSSSTSGGAAGNAGAAGAATGGAAGAATGGVANGGSAGSSSTAGGTAGNGGSGGQAGSGAQGGSGAQAGSGAAGGSAANGGSAGAAGSAGSKSSAGADDGGCGCRTTPSRHSRLGWMLLPGLLLVGARRRRGRRAVRRIGR